MDRYLDIEILPDPEFPAHQLMDALFAKFHRHLALLQMTGIGVSFPQVDEKKPTLGRLLRLHGNESDLALLMAQEWLMGMRDHIHVKGVSAVPVDVEYRQVRRVQAKSNPDRVRRRQMRRHGWTDEEARSRIPDTARETLKLPFLNIGSKSTGHRFPLFIEHRPALGPAVGPFNAYGLSQSATLPWF
ncbi:MAG: type I-F CRISPR-associated endoribonuclease Cas6/Csy4 [Sorangiineae bacterium NIC37A_2]|nr:MAG: type I-F CRISPR-associated endoribonuclease Cas6/Csy4 [Sorangiineae bacterium NIC37A_2]